MGTRVRNFKLELVQLLGRKKTIGIFVHCHDPRGDPISAINIIGIYIYEGCICP